MYIYCQGLKHMEQDKNTSCMNHKKWSFEDDNKLKAYFGENKSYEFMMTDLKRTRKSIHSRARFLGIVSKHMRLYREQVLLKKQNKRRCVICKNVFDMNNFYGKDKRCKPCACEKSKKFRWSVPPEQIISERWKEAKYRAENRELEFSITIDDIKSQYDIQKGKCFYTNEPLELKNGTRKSNPFSMSIDRVNSEIGYTKSNIVLCGKIINSMKLDLDLSNFIELCKKVSVFRNLDVRKT